MKKYFALLAVLVMLGSGCSGEEKPSAEPSVSADYGSHNAMNSLDYAGSYASENETGSIRSLAVTEDGRFTLTGTSGKNAEGRYHWDVTGSTIMLEDDTLPSTQFFVGENYLKAVNGSEEGHIFKKLK